MEQLATAVISGLFGLAAVYLKEYLASRKLSTAAGTTPPQSVAAGSSAGQHPAGTQSAIVTQGANLSIAKKRATTAIFALLISYLLANPYILSKPCEIIIDAILVIPGVLRFALAFAIGPCIVVYFSVVSLHAYFKSSERPT